MSRTLAETRLDELDIVEQPDASCSSLFESLILKGFPEANENPRFYHTSVPGVLESMGNVCIFEKCQNFALSLNSNQRNVFSAVLSKLLLVEDESGCSIVVGLIARASFECLARKHHVQMTLIQRLPPKKGCNNPFEDHVLEFLDNWKEKAIEKVFLKPSELFFKLTNNETMLNDVQIHGYNTYSTLMMLSLQIKFPRPPLATDSIKGVVDFLAIPNFREIASLEFRRIDPNLLPRASGNEFIFSGVSNVSELISQFHWHPRLVRYIEHFAEQFSEMEIIEPLFQSLFNSNILDLSEETKHELWNLDREGEFNLKLAREILTRKGICKPDELLIPPNRAFSFKSWCQYVYELIYEFYASIMV